LKRTEEKKLNAELKLHQMELKYSKLEAAFSLKHGGLPVEKGKKEKAEKAKKKEKGKLIEKKKKTDGESPEPEENDPTNQSLSLQTPKSLLSMGLAKERLLTGPSQFSEGDEPTHENQQEEAPPDSSSSSFNYYGRNSEEIEEDEDSVEGEEDEDEDVDEDEVGGENQGEFGEKLSVGEEAGGLENPGGELDISADDIDFLTKEERSFVKEDEETMDPTERKRKKKLTLKQKYAILQNELVKMREGYRNQSVILSECEKKLEEALEDKAEVIKAKVDVLKLQSTYQLTWVPDDCVTECLQCGFAFSFFTRQHHCRLCGRLFCANCTSNQCPIPSLGYTQPVRVCDHCYLVLLSQRRHEKSIDLVAIEFEQAQDRMVRKYKMWDDYQKNIFFDNLLKNSSLVQLCYLYRGLSTLLEGYNLEENSKMIDSINSDIGYYESDRMSGHFIPPSQIMTSSQIDQPHYIPQGYNNQGYNINNSSNFGNNNQGQRTSYLSLSTSSQKKGGFMSLFSEGILPFTQSK